MQTITLEEARTHLDSLIARLKPGEGVLITRDSQPVARLVAESAAPRQPRQPGSAIGQLIVVQEDDEHLADFKEYMP